MRDLSCLHRKPICLSVVIQYATQSTVPAYRKHTLKHCRKALWDPTGFLNNKEEIHTTDYDKPKKKVHSFTEIFYLICDLICFCVFAYTGS